MKIALATPADAAAVHQVIQQAFMDRPVLDPPATALLETPDSIAKQLNNTQGLVAWDADTPVGALLFEPSGDWLGLARVGVVPAARHSGLAAKLVAAAETHAAAAGFLGTQLTARAELPQTVQFWKNQGYFLTEKQGPFLKLAKIFAQQISATTVSETQEIAKCLAVQLQPGDLIILSGGLGAGKTTFTQGLAAGLGVIDPVTSPTFVISRVHKAEHVPNLVHVDAYRLTDAAELDDLDLDTDLATAVTVVEWGEGLAETLTEARLEIQLSVDTATETRNLQVTPIGLRWMQQPLTALRPQ